MAAKSLLLAVSVCALLGSAVARSTTGIIGGAKSAVGKCPAKDGEYPTYLPDSEDCNIYYECSNGVPLKMLCPPDLCFDTTRNVCAFPPKKAIHSVKSVVGECPARDPGYPTFLPDSEDCNIYYECSNGVPVEMTCPPDLCFDTTRNTCNVADSKNKARSTKSPVGKCPVKDGEYPTYLPDSDDCTLFYECSAGEAVQKECLPGLCFDTSLNVCAFPPKKAIRSVKSVVGECPARDPGYPTFLPDSEDCNIYYECSNGVPLKMLCPPDLCFDTTRNVCAFPPKKAIRSVKSVVGECPARDPGYPTFLPDSEDCNIYYECSNGDPLQMLCPPDLCFDTTLNVCAFPPKKAIRSVKSVVGECPARDPGYPTFLPDSEDCNIYYECSNGVPLKMLCPPDLCFDTTRNVCSFQSDK